jgi:siroheme synthase-like protein
MPLDATPYPVNLVLAGRRVLVVGGGPVALGKVRGLLEAGAEVTVVAETVVGELRELPVRIEQRAYHPDDLAGQRLVVAATGDHELNARIYEEADARGIWVNAADDPAHCSVTLPARVRRGRLLVTVSTGGHSPAVAAWLRGRLEEEIGAEYDVLIGLVAEVRAEARARGVPTESLDWRSVLDSGMLELIRAGRLADARARLGAVLATRG